ncbi:hypothetical protein FJR48_06660 [Sulfurimonas lithotrophica]|uniref:Uncharacterized protein n=1 Tax=Sulfurimonas lithotrophica TaxID=2590022 RepID=A0A5P8P461_9BACT|nr:hypothetical protein FJR48_06660 [Sulfurimonas lithotrophica]
MNEAITKIDFKSTTPINNKAAYVTSQCYTKTEDNITDIKHNPCFSCHINSEAPNYIDDADLQTGFDFSEYTKSNRFINLFKDRTTLVNNISDAEILEYIKKNNYKDSNNNLLLKNKLSSLPEEWDVNSNGIWDGYMPDCYFNFDNEGFDKTPNGKYTLWRAFAYYPFLGTFWPTNGSTDDVLIRLDALFSKDTNGTFNLEIYKLNLAIVESLIKQKDVKIDSVDENKYGVDLNQNNTLDIADTVKFKWDTPDYNISTQKLSNFSMSYVGLAKEKLESNEYLIAPGLYPKFTEFLHSVRYIDIDENDTIKIASRMKELRYAKKTNWNTYSQMQNYSMTEIKEKDDFPDRLRTILGNSEKGLQTGLGWTYQGFIEDAKGQLRPQNYEETLYCIGCHSGVGAITDSTFVFQRKFEYDTFQNGWYHWAQDANGFKNIQEPKTKDDRYEYSLYLEVNHAGDEFRDNDEIIKKFFTADGELKENEITILHNDISHLIIPSKKRALDLNKAYKVIVDEQSYIYGRDAHVKPVENVHKNVIPFTSTGNQKVVFE